MVTLALHGLGIELILRGFERRAPVFPLKLLEASSPPTLTVELSAETKPRGVPPGSEPVFFHGLTRVFRTPRGLALEDAGASLLELSNDGRRITGSVTPASLDDEYSFTHATLFIALVLALRHHGLFHLHAGAATLGDRVVLIPGASGNGKSSTTMALVAAGWRFAGDDAVLLQLVPGGGARILAVPKVFHLDDRSFGPFQDLGLTLGPAYRSNHQKRSLDPTTVFGAQFRMEAPAPTQLLFPIVRDKEQTSIAELPQAEAFGSLVESAPLFLFEGLARAEDQRAMLAEIATNARAHVLELGRDALRDRSIIPRLVAAL